MQRVHPKKRTSSPTTPATTKPRSVHFTMSGIRSGVTLSSLLSPRLWAVGPIRPSLVRGLRPRNAPPKTSRRSDCKDNSTLTTRCDRTSIHHASCLVPNVSQRRQGNSQLGPTYTVVIIKSRLQNKGLPNSLYGSRYVAIADYACKANMYLSLRLSRSTCFRYIPSTGPKPQISTWGLNRRGLGKLFLPAPVEVRLKRASAAGGATSGQPCCGYVAPTTPPSASKPRR